MLKHTEYKQKSTELRTNYVPPTDYGKINIRTRTHYYLTHHIKFNVTSPHTLSSHYRPKRFYTTQFKPTKISDYIRGDFLHLTPQEILQLPPTALNGVSPQAADALKLINITSIFDLASSRAFSDAANLYLASQDINHPIAKQGAVPTDMVVGDTSSTTDAREFQYEDVGKLRSVAQNIASDIQNKFKTPLSVDTIRDLALWPPFSAAQSVRNLVFFPEVVAKESDDPEYQGTPQDLLPKTKEYPIEQTFYTKLVFKDLGVRPTEALEQTGGIDAAAFNQDLKFQGVTLGAFLTFSHKWYTDSVSLGNLLYSLTLAPGESTKIALLDWRQQSVGKKTEDTSETEELDSSQSHNRTISEIASAVANETQTGKSKTESKSGASASASSGEISADMGIVGDILGGPSGSGAWSGSSSETTASTESESSSSGGRSVLSSSMQGINDKIQQHSSAARNRTAVAVQEVTQSEKVDARTRTITNYNHMHALSIHYYEVVQIFRTVLQLSSLQPCLIIPIKPIDFKSPTVPPANVHPQGGTLKPSDAALHPEIKKILPALEYKPMEVIPVLDDDDRRVNPSPTVNKPVTDKSVVLKKFISTNNKYKKQFERINTVLGYTTIHNSTKGVLIPRAAQLESLKIVDLVFNTEDGVAPADITPNELIIKTIDGETTRYNFSKDLSKEIEIGKLLTEFADIQINFKSTRTTSSNTVTERASIITERASISSSETSRPNLSEEVISVPRALNISKTSVQAGIELTFTYNTERLTFTLPLKTSVSKSLIPQSLLGFNRWDKGKEMIEEYYQQNKMSATYVAYRSNGGSPSLLAALARYSYRGKPLLSWVESQPVGYIGNSLIFKSRVIDDADWQKWKKDMGVDFKKTEQTYVPIPSGGVFAEAILGRSNSAEKLDITRFWNWQDSPIPIQAPDIAPLSTDSRLPPTEIETGKVSSPTIGIVNPPPVPDPSGTSAVLNAVANGNMFRDMSGLAASIAANQTALNAAKDLAVATGDQASANLAAGLQARTASKQATMDFLKSVAPIVAGLATGGIGGAALGAAMGAGGGSSSDKGLALNYARRRDAERKTTSGSMVPSTNSSGSGMSTPSGGASVPDGNAPVPLFAPAPGSSGSGYDYPGIENSYENQTLDRMLGGPMSRAVDRASNSLIANDDTTTTAIYNPDETDSPDFQLTGGTNPYWFPPESPTAGSFRMALYENKPEAAWNNLNALSMTEMLQELNLYWDDPALAKLFFTKPPATVNLPRIDYAIYVVKVCLLPSIPNTPQTVDKNQITEAANFIANKLVKVAIRFNSNLPQIQNAISLIIKACSYFDVSDKNHVAVILANATRESTMGRSMYEKFNGSAYDYFENMYGYQTKMGKKIGNKEEGDGYKYRGRGYVQLTGRGNYTLIDKAMPEVLVANAGSSAIASLVDDPDLAATNPRIAAPILVYGMQQGIFTTRKLSHYDGKDGNPYRFFDSREIVNGDKNKFDAGNKTRNIGSKVEKIALDYLAELKR